VLYSGDAPADAGAAAEDDYANGTRAMNEQRWQDAISSFSRVAAAKGTKADAALYWKAYALNKLNRRDDSAATCAELRSQFRTSSWIKDCAALGMRAHNMRVIVKSGDENDGDFDIADISPVPPVPPVGPGQGRYSTGGRRESNDPDTDLKILALNSLMNQDAAKAIPVLRGLLAGNQPDKVKKQALFVLGQNKAPECQALLREVALGKQNPDLQREAIQMLAITQGKKANETLAEIYKQANDERVKKSAISAMFISGDATRLVDLARGEKDLSMKRNIVSQLAIMNDKAAQDYMLELLK
jgi:hypothetical protein